MSETVTPYFRRHLIHSLLQSEDILKSYVLVVGSPGSTRLVTTHPNLNPKSVIVVSRPLSNPRVPVPVSRLKTQSACLWSGSVL